MRSLEPWMQAQSDLKRRLQELDDLKQAWYASKPTQSREAYIRSLVAPNAQQSCATEEAPLSLESAENVLEKMKRMGVMHFVDNAGTAEVLKGIRLPSLEKLVLSGTSQDAELRNYFLVSYYLTERALCHDDPPSPSLEDIKILSGILLRDTSAEELYIGTWRNTLGFYRQFPLVLPNDPQAVLPMSREVPNLMWRWSEYRAWQLLREGDPRGLHAVLMAARLKKWFLQIQPFVAMNERLAGLLQGDYLVRRGWLPAVKDVSDAEVGSECESVLKAQVEILGKALEAPEGNSEKK